MMNRLFPYVPNVNKIKDEFVRMQDSGGVELSDNNPYQKFIKSQGMFASNDSFEAACEWSFMELTDDEELMQKLKEKLMSFQISKDIMHRIKRDSIPMSDLLYSLRNSYCDQDVRVVVSWMQYFGIVTIQNDILYYCESSIESYDDSLSKYEELYPIDRVLADVDIRDERVAVSSYLDMIQDENIVIQPDFQRNRVWKVSQQSRFIESIIMSLPLPSIYLKKERDGKHYLVDGLQRTVAIIDFLNNKYKLKGLKALPSLNGFDYQALKESFQYSKLATKVLIYKINLYILQPSVPMSIVYDLFNRINTGGTQLSRQEIRNCICLGKSTRLLSFLSVHPSFLRAIDNGIPSIRMRDRESVLRCIAFRLLGVESFKGSMDDYMERAMREINRLSDIEIETIKQEFIAVMDFTFNIFGNRNFRLPSGKSRGRVSVSVMETIYYVFAEMMHDPGKINQELIVERYAALLHDPTYLFACRNSTNGTTKVVNRFNIAKKFIMNDTTL